MAEGARIEWGEWWGGERSVLRFRWRAWWLLKDATYACVHACLCVYAEFLFVYFEKFTIFYLICSEIGRSGQ